MFRLISILTPASTSLILPRPRGSCLDRIDHASTALTLVCHLDAVFLEGESLKVVPGHPLPTEDPLPLS